MSRIGCFLQFVPIVDERSEILIMQADQLLERGVYLAAFKEAAKKDCWEPDVMLYLTKKQAETFARTILDITSTQRVSEPEP